VNRAQWPGTPRLASGVRAGIRRQMTVYFDVGPVFD